MIGGKSYGSTGLDADHKEYCAQLFISLVTLYSISVEVFIEIMRTL